MLHPCCILATALGRRCSNMFRTGDTVSVRKRVLNSPDGEVGEAWIVDYRDQQGVRHIKTFARKRDADAHHAKVAVEVRSGMHTAESQSLTVTEAAWQWIESGEA